MVERALAWGFGEFEMLNNCDKLLNKVQLQIGGQIVPRVADLSCCKTGSDGVLNKEAERAIGSCLAPHVLDIASR